MNQESGPASGRRPDAREHATKEKEEKVRGELDAKGQWQIKLVDGKGLKEVNELSPDKRQEVITKIGQEAPEAIDRQRLPRSSSDLAKNYFEELRKPDK